MNPEFESHGGHLPFFARAFVARGDFKIIVLSVLAERPMHGYEIAKYIQEQSKGLYKPSPGSIYPALNSLLRKKFVRVESSERRKTYQITPAGKRFLQGQHKEIEKIMRAYKESLGPDRAALMMEVQKTAKMIAMASKDVTPEQARELIAVCVEAREKMLRIVSK